MTGRELPPIAVVGSGRLGRALAMSLAERGCAATTLVARSGASRRAAGTLLGAGKIALTTDLEGAARGARWLLLAVPDPAIEEVAADLGSLGIPGWRRRVVLHHAGALGPAPLAALAARGAATGVLHPLEAIPRTSRGATETFGGGSARVEGDRRAVRAARDIASVLGLHVLGVRGRLTDEERALYHAAAVLAANDLLALLSLGSDLLVALGARRGEAENGLAHLAATAARNVRVDGSLAAGLTGPIARADVDTVKRHLRALGRRSKAAERAHRLLALRLVEVAAGSGRLDPATAASLRRLLAGGRPGGRTV